MRLPRLGPTPLVLTAGALVVLAGGAYFARQQTSTTMMAAVGAAAVIAAATVFAMPRVHPALPITAGIILSAFSGHWQDMGIPLGLDRPILLYGIAGAFLRFLPDARVRWQLRLSGIHVLLGVVAAYGIISAIWTGTFGQSEATFALSERLGILGALVFTVAPAVFASQRSRDWLLAGFCVFGAYCGVTALLEGFHLNAFVFPRYIVDPAVGIHNDRVRGPFVEAGSFGLALYVCIVCAAIGWVRWKRTWVRVALAAIILSCAIGIVLTVTRQAWLAATLGTVVAMIGTRRLRPYLIPALVAGAAVAGAALLTVPGLNQQATARGDADLPVWDRLNSNRAAWAMTLDAPVFGHGWYSYGTVSPQFLEQSPNYPLRSVSIPHNVFLGFLSELGLLGTGLWLAALIIVIGTAIIGRAPPAFEPWRVGVVAIATAWVVVSNLSPNSGAFSNHILWLFPGVVWAGLGPHPVLERLRGLDLRPRFGTAPRVALMLLAGLVFGGVAYAAALQRTPNSTAETTLSVATTTEHSRDWPFTTVAYGKLTSTYSRLALSDRVIVPAARESGTTPSALRDGLVVTPILDQPFVAVRVKAPSAGAARERSAAVARELTAAVNAFVTQKPERRRLRVALDAAGREQEQAQARLGRVAQVVAERTGDPPDSLGVAEGAEYRRAQVQLAVASLRRTALLARGVGASNVSAVTELRPFDGPKLTGNDRRSVAELFACIAAVIGLLLGLAAGFTRRAGFRVRRLSVPAR